MAKKETNNKRILVGLRPEINEMLFKGLKAIPKVRYTHKTQFVNTAVLTLLKEELREVLKSLKSSGAEESSIDEIESCIDDINEMLR